jgi:hypothetical protein
LARANTKKTRVTRKQVAEHRSKSQKDHSPTWEGCENFDTEKFYRHWQGAMTYYRTEFKASDLKPAVIKWMTSNDYPKNVIEAFKKSKDWRCNGTMGAIASCLLRGMPSVRADFNNGRNSALWLGDQIADIVENSKMDIEEEEEKEVKNALPQVSIQERVREATFGMTEEIEDAIQRWQTDPDNFNPKEFKVLNLLKGKQAKAAHARIIRDFYARDLAELEELASGKADEQLKEGYSHRSKKQIRTFIDFLKEVNEACTMLMQEAKVTRKPRAKKAVPADKVVAKMKYMKTFEPLKLVSINPTDILGAKELWVYNTKTRKLGKYVANEYMELGVKGTSLTGFSEAQSICKTVRKPEEKLKEFKAAGKVQLRKFLEEINATDTRMNGRINEETILLKVA